MKNYILLLLLFSLQLFGQQSISDEFGKYSVETIIFDSSEIRYIKADSIIIRLGSDQVKIDPKNGLRLLGNSMVWDEVQFELNSMKSQGQTAKPDYNLTYLTHDFPQNDTTEMMGMSEEIPHWIPLNPKGHFMVHFDQVQNLVPVYKVAYKWYNSGSAEPATWTISTSSGLAHSYVSNPTGNIAIFPEIVFTGMKLGATIKVILYRKDNVYTGDCRTTRFGLHLEKGRIGSNTEYDNN